MSGKDVHVLTIGYKLPEGCQNAQERHTGSDCWLQNAVCLKVAKMPGKDDFRALKEKSIENIAMDGPKS